MSHLDDWRLSQSTLTAEEEEHLAACDPCRWRRKRLLLRPPPEAGSGSAGTEPPLPPPYEVGAPLARGRGASCRRVPDGLPLAVKFVPRHPATADVVTRALQRQRLVWHANVLPIDDVYDDGTHRWIVTRAVVGPTVAEYLAVHRPAPDAVTALFRPIAEGLAALHDGEVVHGGLDAGTVLLEVRNAEVVPLITDIGYADLLPGEETRITPNDPAAVPLTAPELADGGPPTAAADVYALGVLWLQLARGADRRPPPEIAQCLDPDPALRPTARALLAALPTVDPDGSLEALAPVATACADLDERWRRLSDRWPDRYLRHQPIGSGGYGVVYRAWDVRLRCDVAIKSLRPVRPWVDPEPLVEEFRRAAQLAHPNLVWMYDLFVDEASFFTMEYVDGRPLVPAQDREDIGAIAEQLFAGLAALHAADLVHRDLKLSNILRERGGRVVIVDLGLARAVSLDAHAHDDVLAAGLVLFQLASGAAWLSLDPPSRERIDAACAALPGPPGLADLIRACVDPDPARRPTAEEGRRAVRRADAPPIPVLPPTSGAFVGRSAAITDLRLALGTAKVVRVVGPPGIGKTRLVRHALGALPPAGVCSVSETIRFNGFDQAIRRLGLRWSARDAWTATDRAADLVARWRAADVLWIDDAHGMDPDSVALLRALLQRPDAPPLLLVHRPQPLPHGLAADEAIVGAATLTLGPLDPREVAALAAELELDPRDAEVERCAGNPFAIRRHAARRHLDAPPLLATVPLEAVDWPLALDVLRTAALHGAPVPLDVLAEADESPRFARVHAALTRSKLLVYRTLTELELAHDRDRDLALEGLGAEDRARLHLRLAQAFARLDEVDPAILARHWDAAGRPHLARIPALRAAEASAQVGAFQRAIDQYQIAEKSGPLGERDARGLARALAAAGFGAQAGRRFVALGGRADRIRAAGLLSASGCFAEADEIVNDLLAELNLVRRAATGDVRRGVTTFFAGLVWPAPLTRRGTAADADAADLLWEITGSLGQHHPLRSFAYVSTHLQRALATGDPARAARALAAQLVYADGIGAPRWWIARMDRRVDALATEAGSPPELLAWVSVSRGYRHFMNGEFPPVLGLLDEAEARYAPAAAMRWERTLGWTHRLYTLGHLGQYAAMGPRYAELVQRFQEVGDDVTRALVEAGAGFWVALAEDAPDLAAARIARARALVREPPFALEVVLLVADVHLALYEGLPTRGWEVVTEAKARWSDLSRYRLPRMLVWYLWAFTGYRAGKVGRVQVLAVEQMLRAAKTPFTTLRADVLATLGGSTTAARRCRETALRYGAEDQADAAALHFEPRESVYERAAARGVRHPERLLRVFGGPP